MATSGSTKFTRSKLRRPQAGVPRQPAADGPAVAGGAPGADVEVVHGQDRAEDRDPDVQVRLGCLHDRPAGLAVVPVMGDGEAALNGEEPAQIGAEIAWRL